MKIAVAFAFLVCLCYGELAWEPLGPSSANCFALGVAPSNNDIVYCADISWYWEPMIFKSEDSGATWALAGVIPDTVYQPVDIAADPVDPGVVYVLSERVSWTVHMFYKSTDGGQSWIGYDITPDCNGIMDLSVHPTTPSTLFGAGQITTISPPQWLNALFTSTDAGSTWSELALDPDTCIGGATHIVLAPGDPDIVYVGGQHKHGSSMYHPVVYRSTDGGVAFVEKSSGLTGDGVNALACHTTDTNIVYAGTSDGVFRSVDGGESWSLVLQSDYISCLSTSVDNPGVVYASSFPDSNDVSDIIYKSSDAGSTWVKTSSGIHGYGVVYEHATRNDDAEAVYLAAYTGFYKTTDGGAHWYESISGLGGPIYVTSMGIAPSEPTTLYASGSGYALDYKSTSSGSDWIRMDIIYDGSFLAYAVHNTDPDIVFGAAGYT